MSGRFRLGDRSRTIDDILEMDPSNTLDKLQADLACLRKMGKYMTELIGYVGNDQAYMVSCREWYLAGERILMGLVEFTVNQVISKRFVKKQSMVWTLSEAYLLLQIRTRVINDEL